MNGGASGVGGALLASVLPPGSVQRRTLANGLRVLVRRDASAPVVAIVAYVKAGYFDETDDVAGISHVLEHMYFKGTPTRGVGEIARETKSSGGYLNAGTIYDHTHYYTVLPASGFEAGLAVQADAYANSLIDADELARELEVIIEEAKRKQDSPVAFATESMFALLHDRHRIRRWRIGREDGLRALTHAKVERFYRNFYRPSNTVLAIAGDVDPAVAMELVERYYGPIPDAPVVREPGPDEPDAAPRNFRYSELSGDIQQTEVVFGWRTPALTHPDTPALDLLSAVLSGGRASRLYRAVRDRRLASSVSASNYTPTELGVFTLHAGARPDLAVRAAAESWEQLRCARDGEITDVEVERARQVLEAHWLRRFETVEGQASHLAAWELLDRWERSGEYLTGLLSAGPDDLARVARLYLAPERAALVVYRPVSSPMLSNDAADMLILLNGEKSESLPPSSRPEPPPVKRRTPAYMRDEPQAGVQLFRSASGVPVLIQRRAGPIAYFGWFARGGAVMEAADRAGLASLVTRTALKGTERRSTQRIAEDAEFLGSTLSSAASADGLQYTMSVPVHRLDDAMELLADVLQRPSFPVEALESERAVALASLASVRDDMYRWPMRLATEAAWSEHPYGQSVIGTESSLLNITPERMREFHAAHVLTGSGAIVLVGDIEPDHAMQLVARHFDLISPGADFQLARPVWPSTLLRREEQRDKAQSAIAMLFEGAGREDEARTGMGLIASIASGLGGRFFDELRDKQSLAYTVMATPLVRRRGGAFAAYIATSPEKQEQAHDGLLKEFRKLREAPVTVEELQQAKTYALGTWTIRRESGASVAWDLADAWLYGRSLDEIGEYAARVSAVTAEELMALAQRFFDPARRVEGIVRGAGKSV